MSNSEKKHPCARTQRLPAHNTTTPFTCVAAGPTRTTSTLRGNDVEFPIPCPKVPEVKRIQANNASRPRKPQIQTLEQQHRTQIVHKFFQVCNFRIKCRRPLPYLPIFENAVCIGRPICVKVLIFLFLYFFYIFFVFSPFYQIYRSSWP